MFGSGFILSWITALSVLLNVWLSDKLQLTLNILGYLLELEETRLIHLNFTYSIQKAEKIFIQIFGIFTFWQMKYYL